MTFQDSALFVDEAEIAAKVAAFVGLHVDVSTLDVAALTRLIKVETIPKGGCFVTAGEPFDKLGLTVRGLFKFFYVHRDGAQSIVAFSKDGELITDYAAILTEEPAHLTIEALEDAVVVSVSYRAFEALANRDSTVQRLARRAVEALMLRLVKRERQLLTLTATERYTAFCLEFRSILPRLSQQDIAAYIGVTPVSLSRLTARLRRQTRRQGA